MNGRFPIGRLLAVIASLALVVTAVGCGKKSSTTSSTGTTSSASTTTATTAGGTQGGACAEASGANMGERTSPEPTSTLDTSKTYVVTIETNCGTFKITMDSAQSPNAVASFVSLVQNGFFDKTVFHRIVLGFVVQGGDPTGSGLGGPGYSTVDTPPADATYPHGVVAMAKSQTEAPGTAGSQFFIIIGENVGLPPEYAIVGTVTQGLDFVDYIGTFGDQAENPTKLIEIEHASVAIS